MFGKYNDTPAAISLGGCLFYVAQLLFMTESWLAENGIGPEAIGVALGFTWLGLTIGLIRTYATGPDGQSTYFFALLIAQIGILLNLWHQHLFAEAATVIDDAIIVTVLTALLLIGYFRIRTITLADRDRGPA